MAANTDAKRAAIYVRVSSLAQAAEDKTSLERQEANCRRRAAEDDLTVVEECVVRDAYSASDPYSRTKLEALFAQAERGVFDYVIMDLVDRTTRAGAFDFADICTRFLRYDVKPLWATDRSVDLTTADGQYLAMSKAHFAHMEKQSIVLRFTGGKEGRIAKGLPLRAYHPYGTVWDNPERTRMRWDGDASETVKYIFHNLANGGTASSLIDELNAQHVPTPSQVKGRKNASTVWQPGTIHGIVYDEIYLGIRVHHRYKVEPRSYQERRERGFKSARKIITRRPDDPNLVRLSGIIEPLVDEATFYAAQEQLRANAFFSKRSGKKFDVESVLLSGGHIRCAVCGHGLIPDRRGGPTWHYNCTRSSRLPDGSRCPGVSVSCREVDDFVWQQARWLIRDPERRRKLIEHTDVTWSPVKRIQHYLAQLADVEQREAGLAAEIAHLGGNPGLVNMRARLYGEAGRLQQERDGYQQRLDEAQSDLDREAERRRHLAQLDTLAAQFITEVDEPLTRAEMASVVKTLHPEMYVRRRSPDRPRFELFFNLSGRALDAATMRTAEGAVDTGTWSWQEAADDIRTVTVIDTTPRAASEAAAPSQISLKITHSP